MTFGYRPNIPMRLRSTLTHARALKRELLHRPVPDYRWTVLNRETEQLYRACLEDGGHSPSGDFVERIGYLVPMPVCANCDVPFMVSNFKRRTATR